MITVQVKDLMNNVDIYQELLNKEMKGRAAFALAKIISEIEKEQQAFQETRSRLILEYGEEEENGSFKIKSQYITDFNQKMDILLNSNVDINEELIDFKDLEGYNFTPAQMLVLEPFIKK